MKKLACFAVLGGLSSLSFGFVNINLDNPYQTVTPPTSGSIFLTFSGTIDILNPLASISTAILESPGTTSDALSTVFDAGFVSYVTAATPGMDYTGDLFTVEVNSSTPNGFYWLNSGGLNGLAEFTVTASIPNFPVASDNEMFGVTVVPEPATLAALGLGAAALIRRRRKA